MARNDDDLARLAAELDDHWVAIGRYFVNRKLQSRMHSGVAAELSPVQLRAMTLLAAEPLRVGVLADRIGLAESTVTRLVDRLERAQLVERGDLPRDRRSVVVRLTASGRRVAGSVARARRIYLTDMLEALDPEDRAQLVRLFARIAAAGAAETVAVPGTRPA